MSWLGTWAGSGAAAAGDRGSLRPSAAPASRARSIPCWAASAASRASIASPDPLSAAASGTLPPPALPASGRPGSAPRIPATENGIGGVPGGTRKTSRLGPVKIGSFCTGRLPRPSAAYSSSCCEGKSSRMNAAWAGVIATNCEPETIRFSRCTTSASWSSGRTRSNVVTDRAARGGAAAALEETCRMTGLTASARGVFPRVASVTFTPDG